MAFRNTPASLQTLTITFGDYNFTIPGGSSLYRAGSVLEAAPHGLYRNCAADDRAIS